jgi:hypothetical protein
MASTRSVQSPSRTGGIGPRNSNCGLDLVLCRIADVVVGMISGECALTETLNYSSSSVQIGIKLLHSAVVAKNSELRTEKGLDLRDQVPQMI